VGFLDALFGRSKPAKPDLDRLFAVPSAAITLEVVAGFAPTGAGAVCFKAPEGGSFARLETDIAALLDADGGPAVQRTQDDFGFTWLLVRGDPADVAGLVTDLHAINSTLENDGYGPALLCSLVTFAGATGRRLALVYLYKRGTFYPFAPIPGTSQQRDTALELQVRGQLGDDLALEPDTSRWFPVWGAPGL
jgi:hypothetical protein